VGCGTTQTSISPLSNRKTALQNQLGSDIRTAVSSPQQPEYIELGLGQTR
jgi:hypothetical protein